ncbi:Speckle-type POZ protein B-like protein [Aphelenchoides besseyi]|nr:Speckle-type POZ protein B-like protein [Aphelenchoides besseyi]KAI6210293.1 Speckle-type POZ protein B-like protein [Aphelenchoides besseyi]
MFDKETKEQKNGVVTVKGFETAMVERMLIYIYKNEVVNLNEVAAELLAVADYYQVNTLVQKCSESIVSNLTVHNVLSILTLAFERSHLEDFQERVLKFAHENFKEICRLNTLEDFVSKHPEAAIKLLKISHSIN